ncbi:MAG TPA: thioredoxin [Gammaproteobacteria bacterium]|nr:thioredoxin [Gammaproteobacteria bacterium]
MSDSPYAFNVSADNFDTYVIQNSQQVPVLVDFWADWCAPCKMLMPVLGKLAEEYQGKFLLAKVNSDEQQELSAKYGVRSLPTVMVFRNGEIVDQFMGAQPESVVRELLERHIERESDKQRSEAMTLLQAGDSDAAERLLREALANDPENHRVVLDLAGLLIERQDFDEAESLLQDLPVDKRDDETVRQLLSQLQLARSTANAPDETILRQRIEANEDDLEARYQLAMQRIAGGEHEEGLELLMSVLRKDLNYADGAARQAVLDTFELLGNSGELVSRYRRQLATLLY